MPDETQRIDLQVKILASLIDNALEQSLTVTDKQILTEMRSSLDSIPVHVITKFNLFELVNKGLVWDHLCKTHASGSS